MEDNRRKRVETAKLTIAVKKKRYTAGLHVLSQQYMTGPMVLDDMEEREQQQAARIESSREEAPRVSFSEGLGCRFESTQQVS